MFKKNAISYLCSGSYKSSMLRNTFKEKRIPCSDGQNSSFQWHESLESVH